MKSRCSGLIFNSTSTRFFFSSRRRHTRLTCDWSSDVCSSDLRDQERPGQLRRGRRHAGPRRHGQPLAFQAGGGLPRKWRGRRSEERRVGKEWRPGGAMALSMVISCVLPRAVSALYVRTNEISLQRPYIQQHIHAIFFFKQKTAYEIDM